jgi:Fe2+ or Zn2+ uptake regulation protein
MGLTSDELHQIRTALGDYAYFLEGEAAAHHLYDESCGARWQIDLDLDDVQRALDLIDRELEKE